MLYFLDYQKIGGQNFRYQEDTLSAISQLAILSPQTKKLVESKMAVVREATRFLGSIQHGDTRKYPSEEQCFHTCTFTLNTACWTA